MRLPCDEAVVGTGGVEVPCEAKARTLADFLDGLSEPNDIQSPLSV